MRITEGGLDVDMAEQLGDDAKALAAADRNRRVAVTEIVKCAASATPPPRGSRSIPCPRSQAHRRVSLTALMEPPMFGFMEPPAGADLGSRTG